MENKKRGLFIVFEGVDGCGKTTQAELLRFVKVFEKTDTWLTAEPTKKDIGKLIDRIKTCKSDVNVSKEMLALLFAADRADHVIDIEKKLEQGTWVICDRYFYSSFAYENGEMTKEINSNFLVPDYVFYLSPPLSVCLDRISKRGESSKDIFEKQEVLKQAYDNYEKIFNPIIDNKRIIKISADKPVDEIHYMIYNYIKENDETLYDNEERSKKI